MNQKSSVAVSRNLAHIALVTFLAILLIQSAVGLFIPAGGDWSNIDIVFRTAISSIFGYLMSSIGHKIEKKSLDYTPQPRTIGFSGENSTTSALPHENPADIQISQPPKWMNTLTMQFQTVVISCLCFFCLLVLIFLRYYRGDIANNTSGTIATIAQYRDIISGSLGALIGLARGHQG